MDATPQVAGIPPASTSQASPTTNSLSTRCLEAVVSVLAWLSKGLTVSSATRTSDTGMHAERPQARVAWPIRRSGRQTSHRTVRIGLRGRRDDLATLKQNELPHTGVDHRRYFCSVQVVTIGARACQASAEVRLLPGHGIPASRSPLWIDSALSTQNRMSPHSWHAAWCRG